jgi:hypothetical protein
MGVTTATFTTSAPSRRRTRGLTRTTLAVGAVAAAIVTAAAGLLHAAGVSFDIDGEMIPLLGFAQAAVVLTALSCVPSVTMPDDAATTLALVALHVLAAALVVPVLLRHAHD